MENFAEKEPQHCSHSRKRIHEFSDGTTIEMCPDCDAFDRARYSRLNLGKQKSQASGVGDLWFGLNWSVDEQADSWPRTIPPKHLPVARTKPNKITPLKFIRWANGHAPLSKVPVLRPVEKKPFFKAMVETASVPREDNKEYCEAIRSWPRWVAPTFTFVHEQPATQVCVGWPEWGEPWMVLPYTPPTRMQRLLDTEVRMLPGENGITRTPSGRMRACFCPECFKPVIVGYKTIQAGEPLCDVLMWKRPLHKVPMWALLLWRKIGLVPEDFLSTGKRGARLALADDSYTAGATLGQTEVRVPVIRATKGMFHTANNHVFGYFNLRKKSMPAGGYIVFRKAVAV